MENNQEQKHYMWKTPETEVLITAQEFETVNALVQSVVNTPEAQRAILAVNVGVKLGDIAKRYIESGDLVEYDPTTIAQDAEIVEETPTPPPSEN